MLILLTLGCLEPEFPGEKNVLSFTTNLRSNGLYGAWTPEVPIASGTKAGFKVARKVGAKDEDPVPATVVKVRGLDQVPSEDWPVMVAAQGRDRGLLRFAGEDVEDQFHLRFKPAGGAGGVDAYGPYPGVFEGFSGSWSEVHFIADAVSVQVIITDKKGHPLGFDPALTEMPENPTPDENGRLTLPVSYAGVPLGVLVAHQVPPESVVALNLEAKRLMDKDGNSWLVRASGLNAAGEVVLGTQPECTLDGQSAPVTERVDVVAVAGAGTLSCSFNGHSASLQLAAP